MGLLITIVFIILCILLICASYSAVIYKKELKNKHESMEEILSYFEEDGLYALQGLRDKVKQETEHNRKMLDKKIKSSREQDIDE